jgi:carbonic anhydrase
MPWAEIDRLIEGFKSFRETYFLENRPLFDALAERGQSPKVMVIGCADSRVDPVLITGAGPGDIFVVRNVANLVPPYNPDSHYHGTSSAVEFAVRGLGVEHIIVLGHAQCGGVRALLEGAPMAGGDDFIGAWMSIAEQAREVALAPEVAPKDRQRVCEYETVKVSLRNLLSFPWIRSLVGEGRLTLHGWYFDIADGKLKQLDRVTKRFLDL